MSFVLDALKRSETERQQERAASFAEHGELIHVGQAPRKVWPALIVLLLAINLLVLLYVAFGKDSINDNSLESKAVAENALETESTAQTTPVPRVSRVVPESTAVKSEPIESSTTQVSDQSTLKQIARPSVLEGSDAGDIDWAQKEAEARALIERAMVQKGATPAQEADPVAQNSVPVATTNVAAQDVIRPKKVPEGGALPFPVVAQPEGANSNNENSETRAGAIEDGELISPNRLSVSYRDVPYLYDVASSGRPRTPKISFNSHIFSEFPSARRVMINNIYLQEGASFSGIEVLEIGEADIVFEKDGFQFKLPAMRDWYGD